MEEDMQHTLLITGATQKLRLEKAEKVSFERIGVEQLDNCIDFLLITHEEDKEGIGISTAREIKQWVKTKPTYQGKVVVIPNAENLTLEAQNALLKTLEEPPNHTTIILCAPHKQYLLPTVISRCALILLTDQPRDLLNPKTKASKSSLFEIMKRSPGERLDWVAENTHVTKSRGSLLALLNEWLIIGRDLLLSAQGVSKGNLSLKYVRDTNRTASLLPTTAWLKTVDTLYNARTMTSRTNVDRRLTLEVLLLELPDLKHHAKNDE